MKITIEPTVHMEERHGVKMRRWDGVAEDGTPVMAYIALIAVDDRHNHAGFTASLDDVTSQVLSDGEPASLRKPGRAP